MHILTRHSIESFLDLFNLYIDKEYINVMAFCAKQGINNTGKYDTYKYKDMFTIQSKYNIALSNGLKSSQLFSNELDLINIASDCNRYAHPDVFLDICTSEQKNKKLRELLKTNLYLFIDSYRLILSKFNQSIQPTFNCNNCVYGKNCYNHLLLLKNNFENIINNSLLVDYTNVFYHF